MPWLSGLFVLALLSAAPEAAAQRRDFQREIGPTIADHTAAQYRFERFVVTSADGARSWRVNLGIPKVPPPERGFPAFWMLDGNAALMEFDDALLDELAAGQPQVLVFVGYDNEKRVDTAARTRDYTPVAAMRGEGEQAAMVGGDADAFLDVILGAIRQEVARRAPLDARQQTLWGHSFGGLFTLHALYSGAGGFQTYAPASPSLWWGEGYMLGEPEQRFFAGNAGRTARVLLMLGGGERHPDRSGRNMADPRVAAHMRCVACVPSDSAFQLSERLRKLPGLEVEYHEFPGLGHGPMLRASLLYALHVVAGIPDHSGDARQ
nr:alpha/beta hydrolase-fold protein [Stenotrophomonas sp. MMGLT7]